MLKRLHYLVKESFFGFILFLKLLRNEINKDTNKVKKNIDGKIIKKKLFSENKNEFVVR